MGDIVPLEKTSGTNISPREEEWDKYVPGRVYSFIFYQTVGKTLQIMDKTLRVTYFDI